MPSTEWAYSPDCGGTSQSLPAHALLQCCSKQLHSSYSPGSTCRLATTMARCSASFASLLTTGMNLRRLSKKKPQGRVRKKTVQLGWLSPWLMNWPLAQGLSSIPSTSWQSVSLYFSLNSLNSSRLYPQEKGYGIRCYGAQTTSQSVNTLLAVVFSIYFAALAEYITPGNSANKVPGVQGRLDQQNRPSPASTCYNLDCDTWSLKPSLSPAYNSFWGSAQTLLQVFEFEPLSTGKRLGSARSLRWLITRRITGLSPTVWCSALSMKNSCSRLWPSANAFLSPYERRPVESRLLLPMLAAASRAISRFLNSLRVSRILGRSRKLSGIPSRNFRIIYQSQLCADSRYLLAQRLPQHCYIVVVSGLLDPHVALLPQACRLEHRSRAFLPALLLCREPGEHYSELDVEIALAGVLLRGRPVQQRQENQSSLLINLHNATSSVKQLPLAYTIDSQQVSTAQLVTQIIINQDQAIRSGASPALCRLRMRTLCKAATLCFCPRRSTAPPATFCAT